MSPLRIEFEPRTSAPVCWPRFALQGEDKGQGLVCHGDALSVSHWLMHGGRLFDCVYLDPPFGTSRSFTTKSGAGRYKDVAVETLLELLYPILENVRQLLCETGSLFLHLDYRAVWGAKLVLDTIFGPERFRNQIIWHYNSGGRARKQYSRKHDVILWYAAGPTPYFDPEAVSLPRDLCHLCGKRSRSNHLKKVVDGEGRTRTAIKSNGKIYYYDPEAGRPLSDVWLDIPHLHQLDPERTGYPTQKPLKLLSRIISAHTPPQGRVLDLFAGSGTTLLAAAALGRGFVGGDENIQAIDLVRGRLCAAGYEAALYGPEAPP